MTRPELKKVNIRTIKRLLSIGYTRYERENVVEEGYGYGSIEKYYDLRPTDIKDIFRNEQLKGLKTRVPTYVLVDEAEELEEDEDNTVEELPTFTLTDEDEDEEIEFAGNRINSIPQPSDDGGALMDLL